MTEIENYETGGIRRLPIAAAFLALAGIADSIYLTIHHLTAIPVPCSIISGCETVLTSVYAEIAGIPLAGFGAIAYFIAFALAIFAAFGNRFAWTLFGVQAAIMAVVTCWLLYLQAFVIEAFCQFCLLSAFTSFALLVVFVISKYLKK
ncbi:MAG: vitamin K epoxide reductase family protein [Pyrinomonadaceae bacterium]